MVERHSQDGELTGLLVAYPLCYIHVLEGKTPQLMAFLRDLLNNSPDLRLNETRVIASTEDIPGRFCNAWYAAYTPSTSTVESMDALDAAGAVKSASDVNMFLRRVGSALTSVHDSETRRKLGALEAYFDDVPAQELVLSLAPTEDAPTISEYLDIFDSPVNVDLESEQVWPMPPSLKY